MAWPQGPGWGAPAGSHTQAFPGYHPQGGGFIPPPAGQQYAPHSGHNTSGHGYSSWWGGHQGPQTHSNTAPAKQTRSSKYPNLNPILAEDTSLLRYDIKQKPSVAILASTYVSTRHQFAVASPTQHLRLISKSFPWQIDIVSPANITCDDVWESLYNALQQPIVDSEWGFICQDRKVREGVEKSAKKRCEVGGSVVEDLRPKRIDFLGETTLFRGLEKDEELAKLRVLPGSSKCQETFIVKLVS